MKFIQNTILFFGLFGVLGTAHATTVQNEISVSASTGGNTAGQEIQGKSEVSVFIETTVDGEVVEHIEEHKEDTQGNPVEIRKETSYQDGEVQVQTQSVVEVLPEDNANKNVEEVEPENESKPLLVALLDFIRDIFSNLFFA